MSWLNGNMEPLWIERVLVVPPAEHALATQDGISSAPGYAKGRGITFGMINRVREDARRPSATWLS